MFNLFKAAYLLLIALVTAFIVVVIHIPSPAAAQSNCSPAYPDVCIAPAPPDLDCKDISHRNFKVVAPDPHKFDGDKDGIGCEEQKNS
jgi:micrococcal nuclease